MTVTSVDPRGLTSADLVGLAQKGDPEAFGQLYDRYVNDVFRFIYFRVGDREQAEDMTSETFLRALRRICAWTNTGEDIKAWLVTIARNLLASHFRDWRTYQSFPVSDFPSDFAAHGDGAFSEESYPEKTVVDRMNNADLFKAIRKLQPEQRECIVLRFLLQESVISTARIMGRTPGAVKAMQFRAMNHLRRSLAHLGPGALVAA